MDVFPTAGGGPEAMANAFGVPFLGRVPLDARLGAACEAGIDFLSSAGGSVAGGGGGAVPAFASVVNGRDVLPSFF